MTHLVLLPVTYNDGSLVPGEEFTRLTRELTIAFGGFTLMPAAFGEWVDQHGRFQADKHRPVMVDVPEGRHAELEQWIKWAGKELDQEVMLLLRNFCEAEFIEVPTW